MTTPTTHDVVLRLAELSRLLDAKTREIAELDEAAVLAKSGFEVAFARAFLSSEGAMDVRKQTSVLATSDVKLDAEIAEQKVRAAREAIRTLRDQLDVGRSLNAAVRSEWVASASGQPS